MGGREEGSALLTCSITSETGLRGGLICERLIPCGSVYAARFNREDAPPSPSRKEACDEEVSPGGEWNAAGPDISQPGTMHA